MPGQANVQPEATRKAGTERVESPVSPRFRETECSVVLLHLGR
jgi:hypothetical protein